MSDSDEMFYLQQALKMSLEAQTNENPDSSKPVDPMSESDKQWLSGALSEVAKSASDIAKQMQTNLDGIASLLESELTADRLREIGELIENITEQVEDLDLAGDCIKLGGHKILLKCLNYNQLIRGSCETLATLAQNNLLAQQSILDLDAVPTYLSLLTDSHLEEEDKKKVLYALSCLCRGYPAAIDTFKKHQGFYSLAPFIGNLHSLLCTKAVFFTKSLIEFDTSLKEDILESGLLEILISKLEEPRKETHEHILTLLASCLAGGPGRVRTFCVDRAVAKKVHKYAALEGIHEEEVQACQSILNSL